MGGKWGQVQGKTPGGVERHMARYETVEQGPITIEGLRRCGGTRHVACHGEVPLDES